MKTPRPIVLLLLLVCLTGVSLAQAQVRPCYLASPGERCTTTIFQALGDALMGVAKSLGEALGAALVELKAKLQEARTKVFSSNLSGPQLQQAQAELGQLLAMKDYYLCLVDVLLAPKGPGVQGAAGAFYNQLGAMNYKALADFDGNVPPFARGLFNTWTAEVAARVHSDTPPGSLTEVFSRYQNAIQKTTPAYQRYEIARDWAEYAAAGRNLTQDPRQYAVFLIAIKRPWAPPDFPVQPNIMADSSKYYSAMAALFGQDALDKAVRTVMTSKKDGHSRLVPALRAGGAEYSSPWPALWAALGETNARNYVLTQIAFFARGGLEGASSVPFKNLEQADAEYQQFVASRGQDAVLRIAKLVHDAAKTPDGQITDARLLGATSGTTKQALEELLRASINPAATAPTADLIDNPDYLAWAHHKVGATAVYAEDRGRRDRSDFYEKRLHSIDANGATVTTRGGDIYASDARYQANEVYRQESIPARLSPGARRSTVPEESGTQTLRVNGKIFACRWEKRGSCITWTSDEVPGGLVMRRCGNSSGWMIQPQLTNAGSLHSVNDIRFDIQAISKDGPFQ